MKRYRFKVEYLYDDEIYRVFEMDGRQTLEDLHNAIQKMFDFDNDHLYMFSLSRKRYDPDGYYSPYAEDEKGADEITLDELGLNLKKKFMYLFDFGDDWEFTITVQKKMEAQDREPWKELERQGKLEQYPGEEDIFGFPFDDSFDDADDDCDADDDWQDNILDEEVDKEDDDIIEIEDGVYISVSVCDIHDLIKRMNLASLERTYKMIFHTPKSKGQKKADLAEQIEAEVKKGDFLKQLPPSLKMLLLNLNKKEGLHYEYLEDHSFEILLLSCMGLVSVDEDSDYPFGITLIVPQDLPDVIESAGLTYPSEDDLRFECGTENIVQYYGIIHKDFFEKIIKRCGCKDWNHYEAEIFQSLIRLEIIKLITFEGIDYVTYFDEKDAETVLNLRKEYKVKDYKCLPYIQEKSIFDGGEPEYVQSFNKIMSALERKYPVFSEDMEAFTSELYSYLSVGLDRDLLDDVKKKWIKIFGKMTKAMEKDLENARNTFPAAVLKGYTFKEYEENKESEEYRQLSLFDEMT